MKKAFTLIELIATIVILGVVTSIVSILIMNVIRNVKDSANKRSIDNYGRIADTAMSEYQSQYLKYPTSFDELNIEYTGSKVECNISRINPDKTIYLSECKVNGKKVLDKKTEDGYYHYGKLVLTNEEYVDKLGNNIELALKDYYEENNKYPINYRLLNLPKLDKDVNCVSEIHQDGTVYLTKCSIDGSYILNENEEDGYYHYGNEIPTAAKYLLKKSNPITVTNYIDGDIHEMYTFEHEVTEQTPALTDYRYIGNDPNNYVEFNNELWRIIGVFKVEDENGKWEDRIKIVRNEKLSNNMQWNSSNTNDWSKASLNTYLNNDYYKTLTSNAKAMIKSAKYYLGGNNILHLSGEQYYSFERGNKNLNNYPVNFVGKISIVYPSDYIYTFALEVSTNCFNDGYGCEEKTNKLGWMFKNFQFKILLLNPNINNQFHAYIINESGAISNIYGVALRDGAVYPSLYLSSSVRIISGTGASDNPYQLSMN